MQSLLLPALLLALCALMAASSPTAESPRTPISYREVTVTDCELTSDASNDFDDGSDDAILNAQQRRQSIATELWHAHGNDAAVGAINEDIRELKLLDLLLTRDASPAAIDAAIQESIRQQNVHYLLRWSRRWSKLTRALEFAASLGHQGLIRRVCDFEWISPYAANAMLKAAAGNKQYDMVVFLVGDARDCGVRVDQEGVNWAMREAAAVGDARMVNQLINESRTAEWTGRFGRDHDATLRDGIDMVMMATAIENQPAVLSCLEDFGLAPKAEIRDQALIAASKRNNVDWVTRMLHSQQLGPSVRGYQLALEVVLDMKLLDMIDVFFHRQRQHLPPVRLPNQ